MKILNFKIAGLLIFLSIISCSSDKQAKLAELKKKHVAISEQIRQLETELADSDTINLDNSNLRKVATKELKTEVFNHYLEVQGKLDGEENLGISAKTPGVVVDVLVKIGDKVSKGQVLAKLDDAILQQSLQQLEANLNFVTELYEKQKNLWEQKIGSEVQFLSAKNNKESIENSIKTLKDQIDMTLIKSPINGSVEDVSVKIGQSAAPGLPLFRIINFSTTKVVADIAEAYAIKVNVGDEVLVKFPDLQKEIVAKISSASKYISPQNRTFQIEVRINTENIGFKANMIAILEINDYQAENAIVIPINLIQNDQEGSFVFLAMKENPKTIAKKVKVKTGQIYNGLIEVIEGLKAGDLLITAGQQDLQDGEAVRL